MSYILDALRKSDQQRQHGAAPTLRTAQPVRHTSKPAAFWLFGVLALAMVGAGMAIGWLRPWDRVQPLPPTPPVGAKPAATTSTETAMQTPIPAQSVLTQELPARESSRIQPRNSPPAAAAAKKQAAIQSADAPRVDTASASRSAPATKVLPMSELPPAIQQEIPPMSISVHAYSSRPTDRMVSINDRLLREGGTVPPGLTLDEITPDGMVFSYKGYRFRRGLGAAESR